MTSSPLFSRVDYALSALSTLACLTLFLPFANVGVDVHHDGLMLKPALDVLDGQVLHRDTFTQYGPLTTLIHAGLMGIFGERLLVLRVATVVAESVAIGLFTLAWRSLMPWRVILAIVLLWCCLPYFYQGMAALHPWSSSLAMLFQSACFLSMAVALRAPGQSLRIATIAAAGVCASATFWCRQPVGGLLAMAGASIPIAMRLRGDGLPSGSLGRTVALTVMNPYLRAYVLGGIGFALVMLGWLTSKGALADWFAQNVVHPRAFATSLTTWESVFRSFISVHAAVSSLALFVIALATREVWRRTSSPPLRGLCWIGIGIAWFGVSTVYPRYVALPVVQKMIPLATCGCLAILICARNGQIIGAALSQGMLIPALSSWAQFYPVNCIRHMYWSLGAIVGIFVFLLGKSLGLRPNALAAALVLFTLPVAAHQFQEARGHLKMLGGKIEEPALLAGMRGYLGKDGPTIGSESDLAIFAKLHRELHNNRPELPMMLVGPDAMWTLAARNRKNPGPYYVDWSALRRFGSQADRARFLVRHKPLVLLEMNPGETPRLPPKAVEMGYVPEFRGRASGTDVYVLWPPREAKHSPAKVFR